MDDDLAGMTREDLIAEVRRLRAGIRTHRDSTGHELCWHHPQLWALLPERVEPSVAVPPWPTFLRGCLHYRESLDRQLPGAPVHDAEYDTPREGQAPSSPDREAPSPPDREATSPPDREAPSPRDGTGRSPRGGDGG